ncbi:DUF6481 family protein [Neorhizobium alkalisoli]|uniref:Uncharacterized protein n=1 Tax=Neorhizobium alkalisoli TaxID=528178 RepID=A0A561QS12_9HYPH|nr:DUF6481 family protein [Neorhizobium alkalisoli]TWF53185.1 hypothetical protein FHW37_104460 [Neorhizobium alkalisoli]
MRNVRDNELTQRRNAAADAKAALLQAFIAKKDADAPAREARQAERRLVAEARAVRQAERQQAKLDERNREMREAAERHAAEALAARAEVEAREMADANRVTRVVEDEAARKAERDRKYAARKARRS